MGTIKTIENVKYSQFEFIYAVRNTKATYLCLCETDFPDRLNNNGFIIAKFDSRTFKWTKQIDKYGVICETEFSGSFQSVTVIKKLEE